MPSFRLRAPILVLALCLAGFLQAALVSAACPLSVSGMDERLYLRSTGKQVGCVWPDADYDLEVFGPSNNWYYCIVPNSTGTEPRSPVGFTTTNTCKDATYGDITKPFNFRLRTVSPLPAAGIEGGVSPGGCSGSDLTLEHAFFYPKCPATSCTPPPNNLDLWLPLDESSGTTVRDISGTVSGTRYGATITTGRVSRALSFDGYDDYVQFPDLGQVDLYLDDFTIDAWVRTTKQDGIIVAKRDDLYNGYLFMIYSGRPMLQMGQGGTWVNYGGTAFSSPRVDDGAWHFVAVTVDRDSATGGKLYVDGNPVFTFNPATFTSRTLSNSAPVRLGQTGQAHDTYAIYQGQIDEVEIFRRVLSEVELDKIYAAGSAGKCKATPAVCGNSICESGETCSSCANDCGACPVCDNDGFCELGEGRRCIDCQPQLDCDNDGICELGEDQDTCNDCCDPQVEICFAQE